jgi:Zn-dependent protease with chaperone function/type II secretory pathway pseudopilin PulG
MHLVYKNEKPLFTLMLALSALAWLLILLGTVGMVLIYFLFGFLFYCFAQSALISYIKGTGVRITEEQYPDLKQQISACCRKLGVNEEPQAYLLQMGGMLNAFATRFLGRDFLVLYTDVVDGLADNPDALNFYIGHELGHIRQKHLSWSTVLMPASVLPLVGAAYSRAREYTCDRHGLAACDNPLNAEHGLAVLAAGGKRARTLNTQAYIDQSEQTEGFWMSFHELVGDYPWLVKRMAAVRALAAGQEPIQPSRNKLAAVLALFVPRLGVAGGAGAGVVVLVALIGILAAVAIPAYQGYTQKARSMAAYKVGQDATGKVGAYYMKNEAIPATLEEAGVRLAPSDAVNQVQFDPDNGNLRVETSIAGAQGAGALVFTPSLDANKRVVWRCSGENLMPAALPAECR